MTDTDLARQIRLRAKHREFAVYSLKELVVILTGLTITKGLEVAITRLIHYFSHHNMNIVYSKDPPHSFIEIWFSYFANMQLDGVDCIFRLLLLIICVMRFHHGNIMIIEKAYVLNADTNRRIIWLDSAAILFCSIGFGTMGFLIFSPALFYSAFLGIMLVSVGWSLFIVNKQKADIEIRRAKMIPEDFIAWHSANYSEYNAQDNWWKINIVTSFFFVIIYLLPHVPYRTFVLDVVILINSILDIRKNWDDYFPSASEHVVLSLPSP